MKIYLSAFGGKLSSKVMDVPEETGPIFRMVMTQPPTAIIGYHGNNIAEHPPFDTLCIFEWTGKSDMQTGARLYELKDIDKRHMPI